MITENHDRYLLTGNSCKETVEQNDVEASNVFSLPCFLIVDGTYGQKMYAWKDSHNYTSFLLKDGK